MAQEYGVASRFLPTSSQRNRAGSNAERILLKLTLRSASSKDRDEDEDRAATDTDTDPANLPSYP
jgi:hypothetical protein